ncbi:DUF7511 domain-containing protein [Haloarcula japonica]|uniref:DUF7511 domain-containing protein n=1 Tax=Haloarcula japonica TaxID=29282 RepID=UPI001EF9E553|nr:hypothetical protein [Haloarcula japonica]
MDNEEPLVREHAVEKMQESNTEAVEGDERICRAIIEQSGAQPDQLTIFSATDQNNSNMSAWITATEDSFVYLSLVR